MCRILKKYNPHNLDSGVLFGFGPTPWVGGTNFLRKEC